MAFWMRQGGKVEMPPNQIQLVEAFVGFSFPAQPRRAMQLLPDRVDLGDRIPLPVVELDRGLSGPADCSHGGAPQVGTEFVKLGLAGFGLGNLSGMDRSQGEWQRQ
ncbi:hypothetical protein WV31_11105 [Magnetospirillum sp. ME-1]|nr:hypothetical protein WV31_11105 [Magnetospirillum sp. ME-1]